MVGCLAKLTKERLFAAASLFHITEPLARVSNHGGRMK